MRLTHKSVSNLLKDKVIATMPYKVRLYIAATDIDAALALPYKLVIVGNAM